MIKLEKLKISIQTEGLGYYMSKQLDSSYFCASFGASFIEIRWMGVENDKLQNSSFSFLSRPSRFGHFDVRLLFFLRFETEAWTHRGVFSLPISATSQN